jgi:hypothetical protein
MVYTRYFWQGSHQMYGHIRCIYTVLAKSYICAVYISNFVRKVTQYVVMYGVYRYFLTNPAYSK